MINTVKLNSVVDALNIHNEYAKDVLRHELPQLQKLIGLKVQLASGEKSKKWNVVPFKGAEGKENGVYVRRSHYYEFKSWGLVLNVRICVSDTSSKYIDKGFSVAELTENKEAIASIHDFDTICKEWKFDKVYSAEDIAANIETFEKAKEAASKAYSAIPDIIRTELYITRH